VSFNAGRVHLRVDSIEQLLSVAPPAPRDVQAIDILNNRFPGQLVRVVGRLNVPDGFAERQTDSPVTLRDNSGEIRVTVIDSLEKERSVLTEMGQGGTVAIVGVAAQAGGRLVPVAITDFAFAPRPPYALILGVAALGLTLTLFASVYRRRRLAEALARRQGETLAALERSEAALRTSEAGYRSFVHNLPFGVYRSSSQGRLLDVNPALVTMLGFSSAGEMLALRSANLYRDPDERATILGDHPNGVDGYETEFKQKDGTPIHVRLTSRHVRLLGVDDMCYEITVENMTERRALEQQLRQAQKLEAIGRLAGGVAHDFNNQLVPILGYAGLLAESLAPNDPRREDIEQIQKAAERAASSTKQLLAFSRKQILRPTTLNLNTLLLNMMSMLQRLIGEDVTLTTELGESLAPINADSGQIEKIVMDLAVNARDALPAGGGDITIATSNVDVKGERREAGGGRLAPGSYVMLEVRDTGVGMTPEIQERIFEPFFTTKEVGKGTGLGLATVYGVVQQSGGGITVESEPGHGTSFKIYFPQAVELEAVDDTEPYAAADAPAVGDELVLLVEDEEPVRRFACAALERSGYCVLEASGAEEAVRMFERSARPVDLLLTDVVMPGWSGVDLSDRLTESHPELKVLYMSGYTDDRLVHEGVLDPGTALLQKPFTPAMLARKVREVLTY
jgi:PAS domain S-box-containing protein